MTSNPFRTDADLQAYLQRARRGWRDHPAGCDSGTPGAEPPASEADEGPESGLQGKIQKYCKDHGFPCQCNRKSRKAKGFLTKGWFD